MQIEIYQVVVAVSALSCLCKHLGDWVQYHTYGKVAIWVSENIIKKHTIGCCLGKWPMYYYHITCISGCVFQPNRLTEDEAVIHSSSVRVVLIIHGLLHVYNSYDLLSNPLCGKGKGKMYPTIYWQTEDLWGMDICFKAYSGYVVIFPEITSNWKDCKLAWSGCVKNRLITYDMNNQWIKLL